jgi:hypothetical protein
VGTDWIRVPKLLGVELVMSSSLLVLVVGPDARQTPQRGRRP